MDICKNAHLTQHSRAELVRRELEEGLTPKAVLTAVGYNLRLVLKLPT